MPMAVLLWTLLVFRDYKEVHRVHGVADVGVPYFLSVVHRLSVVVVQRRCMSTGAIAGGTTVGSAILSPTRVLYIWWASLFLSTASKVARLNNGG
jgi:hypothetical protein